MVRRSLRSGATIAKIGVANQSADLFVLGNTTVAMSIIRI
jgi:hypothetical protein